MALDTQGLLNACFDQTAGAFRVVGSGDIFFLPPTVFGIITGTPVLSFANNVPSYEMDAAAVEAVVTAFQVPTFWSSVAFDLWHGRRSAGTGNVRHRLLLKDLATGDLVTEAATNDISANVTPGAQNVITNRSDHFGAQISVTTSRYFALTYERTATDAGDTYTLDSSLFGVAVRRGS